MDNAPASVALADDLRVVVGQLVRRFRQDRALPAPQFGALGWINRLGPQTTSRLATLEGVRPQSMAHTVAQLTEADLVVRVPDAYDRRQVLIDLSDLGRASMDDFRRAAVTWVDERLRSRLTADERDELAHGLELLSRLVDD